MFLVGEVSVLHFACLGLHIWLMLLKDPHFSILHEMAHDAHAFSATMRLREPSK